MSDIKTLKLSKKYQITLPRNVREFLDIGAGDSVSFYIDNGEIKLTSRKNLKVKISTKDTKKEIKILEKDEVYE